METPTFDFFNNVLPLIGGLCLFLFGMNIMGDGLEKSAGSSLKSLLTKLTSGKVAGFLTGLGVTSVIQSSSATTVMVVGFVNSGIMTLKQAINVIMGANVGTTVTAWILSLAGVEGNVWYMQILKPTSFTPILALIGIGLTMLSKKNKHKDIGSILLGFATLMFGMDAMSGAVEVLKEIPEFQNFMIMFQNPVLGVLAGAVLTGIIQSSSASVGILQALSSTGAVTIGASIPIIMGQNIGTCVTALISSVGTNRNARRASIVHLAFNVIGTTILLAVYCVVTAIVNIEVLSGDANELSIAICHSAFNIICTAIMLPMSGLLEKISYAIVREPKGSNNKEKKVELDERLMETPAIAINQCHVVASQMADVSMNALKSSLTLLDKFDDEIAEQVKTDETAADHYEDVIGSYLVKLSTYPMSDADSHEANKLLFVIGDLERISDHAVNILRSADEIKTKDIKLTEPAKNEIKAITGAVSEILDLTLDAFVNTNLDAATSIEPLEEVIDTLKVQLRANHILRMQKGECSIEAGFVWADIITNLERVSDHCSNIAGCIIEMSHDRMDIHEYYNRTKHGNPQFESKHKEYAAKYAI
ncbi:MAG: Na/Pi cotransporter family protein [Ruminococcaceae bacterium]|nr:Na/Pi cotransporter family protein [Oscillospiraceae bacterium]